MRVRSEPCACVGSRRVRVRESDLDAFLQASTGSTVDKAPPRAGEAEDPSALLWTRLGIVFTESSDAPADQDLAKLPRSFNALADAAGTLADALGEDASGQRHSASEHSASGARSCSITGIRSPWRGAERLATDRASPIALTRPLRRQARESEEHPAQRAEQRSRSVDRQAS